MSKLRRINPTQIKLLSVSEISEKYDFHANTIRLWIKRDGLRCYRKGPGGKIMVREDDLKRFFEYYYE